MRQDWLRTLCCGCVDHGQKAGQGQGRSKKLAGAEAAKTHLKRKVTNVLKKLKFRASSHLQTRQRWLFDQGVTAAVGPNGSGQVQHYREPALGSG